MVSANRRAYLVTVGGRALRWPLHLAEELNRRGIKTTIITPVEIKLVDELPNVRVDLVRIPLFGEKTDTYVGRLIFSILLVPKIVREKREILFIHANSFFPNLVCSFLAKALNIPLVVICTDVASELYTSFGFPLPFIGSRLASLLDRIYSMLATAIITDSVAGKRFFTSRGVKHERVETIPHGVNLSLFRPQRKSKGVKSLYSLHGKKVLLFHGDVGEVDGVDTLVDSLQFLGPLRKQVKILIVGGGGAYFKKLKREVDAMGIKEITFTGWVAHEEIPRYISVADVYVIPWKSTLDTNIKIPSKLIEAMAMGKPVVASRLKSLETLFRDGRDIMFFNPNDSKDLAEKVSLLLKDSKLRRKLGRRAKELSKQFSWSVLMKRELNFLKRMGIIKT